MAALKRKSPHMAGNGGEVENWILGLIIKPLVALAVFVPVLLLSRWLYKVIPDSKLKRLLFSPLPGHKGRRWD